MKDKPADQFIKEALYEAAKQNQYCFYVFTSLGFVFSSAISILSITGLKFIADPNFIFLTIVVSIVFIICGYYYQRIYKLRYAQAEKFRKKDFIDDVLKSSINNIGDGYIYYSLGRRIIQEAKILEANKKDQTEDNSPYFTVLKTYEGHILECMQQNCNQTSINLINYYHNLSKRYIPFFFGIIGCVGLGLILAMINFQNRAFDTSQLFIALISFYFSLDFYNYYTSFKSESLQLDKLQSEIGIVKENVGMPEVMYYFSEYVAILETAPMTPYWIHKEHEKEINIEWRSKLLKEQQKRESTAANKSITENAG